MKNFILIFLLSVFGTQLMAVKPAHATEALAENTVNMENIHVNKATSAAYDGGILSKLLKKNKTVRKMATWVQNKLMKDVSGLNHPIHKWLWYAIILVGISIILSIILWSIPFAYGMYWIRSLVISVIGLAATASFIYWLILFIDSQ